MLISFPSQLSAERFYSMVFVLEGLQSTVDGRDVIIVSDNPDNFQVIGELAEFFIAGYQSCFDEDFIAMSIDGQTVH